MCIGDLAAQLPLPLCLGFYIVTGPEAAKIQQTFKCPFPSLATKACKQENAGCRMAHLKACFGGARGNELQLAIDTGHPQC